MVAVSSSEAESSDTEDLDSDHGLAREHEVSSKKLRVALAKLADSDLPARARKDQRVRWAAFRAAEAKKERNKISQKQGRGSEQEMKWQLSNTKVRVTRVYYTVFDSITYTYLTIERAVLQSVVLCLLMTHSYYPFHCLCCVPTGKLYGSYLLNV